MRLCGRRHHPPGHALPGRQGSWLLTLPAWVRQANHHLQANLGRLSSIIKGREGHGGVAASLPGLHLPHRGSPGGGLDGNSSCNLPHPHHPALPACLAGRGRQGEGEEREEEPSLSSGQAVFKKHALFGRGVWCWWERDTDSGSWRALPAHYYPLPRCMLHMFPDWCVCVAWQLCVGHFILYHRHMLHPSTLRGGSCHLPQSPPFVSFSLLCHLGEGGTMGGAHTMHA